MHGIGQRSLSVFSAAVGYAGPWRLGVCSAAKGIGVYKNERPGGPARILVVDDEPHIVDFVILGLRREGYETWGAIADCL